MAFNGSLNAAEHQLLVEATVNYSVFQSKSGLFVLKCADTERLV